MLKEGLQGAAAPNGPGTLARGDGESCPSGDRCSRRACGGQQLPKARAHHPGGTGSPAQAVVVALGGHGGQQLPTARAHQPWGTESLAQAVVDSRTVLAGGGSVQRRVLAAEGGGGQGPCPVAGHC